MDFLNNQDLLRENREVSPEINNNNKKTSKKTVNAKNS